MSASTPSSRRSSVPASRGRRPGPAGNSIPPAEEGAPCGEDESEGVARRRLRADAERNRQRVIEAATEAFAADGIAVPMETIAHRAGVGVGTIYRQFPSKESLYSAVVRHGLEQMLEEVGGLASAGDPGEALYLFVCRVLDAVAAKRDLLETLEQSGTDVKAELGPVWDKWARAVAVLVERAQRAGAVRGDITADEAMALIGGTCSAVAHSALEVNTRERLASVLCDGLSAPGNRRPEVAETFPLASTRRAKK